jgi:hypothetical protein
MKCEELQNSIEKVPSDLEEMLMQRFKIEGVIPVNM